MSNTPLRFGYRIVGSVATRRRLVDAGAALAGYASCDPRAEVDREAYLSAFWFGADFRAYLESTGSPKGYNGVCWAPFVWWDIDHPDDLQRALSEARGLAGAILDRYRTLAEDDLLLFFSGGSKGFHIGLPVCWDAAPSFDFNRVVRRLAEQFAALVRVTIDTGIYDKVRPFRAPNSRHPKTGLHKRRLTHDELMRTVPRGHPPACGIARTLRLARSVRDVRSSGGGLASLAAAVGEQSRREGATSRRRGERNADTESANP